MFIEQVVKEYVSSPVRALDLCAAPGGKTTHLASVLPQGSMLVSNEPMPLRAQVLAENVTKWGNPASVVTRNMPDDFSSFRNFFDLIVVDAPCSGLGIIRKKPDIKYQRKQSDISDLSKISSAILNAGAQYVKSGGYLLFSTCTITKEENENVLFDFLETHKEFKLKSISCTKDNDGYITLYPHTDDCDGFFISLMTKE